MQAFVGVVESAVVHYGDTTLTFLNNMYKADARGTALTYVSAVAVEEKSVIDYNRGNPDGILDAGEEPRPPRGAARRDLPEGGHALLRQPVVHPRRAVGHRGAEAGRGAVRASSCTQPENQREVLEFGFRPGNPSVAIGDPIIAEPTASIPTSRRRCSRCPTRRCWSASSIKWDEQRKAARVLLVIDVSGSMGDPADARRLETKLDLAKRAAIAALDEFKDEDEVGLRVFSTDLSTAEPTNYLDLVPVGPIGPAARCARSHDRLAHPDATARRSTR